MPHGLDTSSSGNTTSPDADAPDVILPKIIEVSDSSIVTPPALDNIANQIFGKLKALINWLICKLEACFIRIKAYMATWNTSESPREEFMKMANDSIQAMYATSEKAIVAVEDLPAEYLGPAVKWWGVAWRKTTEFATQIGRLVTSGFVGMRQGLGNSCENMWEKVKALSSGVRKAISDAWAKFMSIWDGGSGHTPQLVRA
ncbi:hypothetical protein Q9L58_007913 [Maublancomyces gigas]|uniref:Uncharacterized protein n=1 Tax=Discina gigas TaxID=1032678 RepID=A0ABR3GB49_9PEZI